MRFPRNDTAWVLLCALFVPAALGTFRWTSGAGFGFLPAQCQGKRIPLGILTADHDNLMYGSWPQQAQEGALLFEDRYTLEPHRPVFFNPTFLAIGLCASWCQIPSQAMFVFAGLISSSLVVVFTYILCTLIGLSRGASLCALILATFAGGSSGLYPCGSFLQTAFANPFICIAYAQTGAALVLIALLEKRRNQRFLYWSCAVALLLLIPVMGATHPYEYLIITATYFLFALGARFRQPDAVSDRARIFVTAILFFSSAWVLGYHTWLSTQSVWREAVTASLQLPLPRMFWVLEYGALFLAAFAGCWFARSAPGQSMLWWFILWYICVFVALVVLRIPQTKIISALGFPLSILGGLGLHGLHSAASAADKATRRLPLTFLLMLGWIGSLVGPMLLLPRSFGKDYRIDGDMLHLIRMVDDRSTGRPARVLCGSAEARVLCAYAPAKVYCGNLYKTLNYESKRRALIRAGLELDDHAGSNPDAQAQQSAVSQALNLLLRDHAFDYVLTTTELPAASILGKMDSVKQVGGLGKWRLFALRRSAPTSEASDSTHD